MRVVASILLGIFTGFLVAISVNFTQYIDMINASEEQENLSVIPEERNDGPQEEEEESKDFFEVYFAEGSPAVLVLSGWTVITGQPLRSGPPDLPLMPPQA